MYIPSLDMGEYDEYGSGASRRPPVNQDSRNPERDRARNMERLPSRKKLDNMPRLPSGYFILDTDGDPLAAAKQKPGLRRELSMSSLNSGPRDTEERATRTLPRQSSRAKLTKQQSRGSFRRQQSASRLTERKSSVSGAPERDVYTGNSGAWQHSLRGAAREEGESTRGRPRTVRTQSTTQQPGRLGSDQQKRRSRSKSLTRRSPSPGGKLLDSTFASRAKTGETRRQSRAEGDRPRSSDSGYYSRPPPTIVRRSASPESGAEVAAGENPFKNYRSFDEFRSNKQQPAGETSTDRRASSGYSRNSTSSRSQRSSYTSPGLSMGGSCLQGYKSDLRKVSNSSTESDSCFGSYTEEHRSLGESAYTTRSSNKHSSGSYTSGSFGSSYASEVHSTLASSSSGKLASSRKSFGSETVRSSAASSSPIKFSLGALKKAKINAWEE